MGTSWPLVGRQDELDRAIECCRAGGVLLSGPAGVGKTRLAHEVVASLGPDPVVRVRATEVSSRMPLGAFAQVLAAAGNVEGDVARLGAAATQLLDALADDGYLVVSVDDVHHLDDTSATLLLHLALSGRARLVMTLRSGVQVPEPITLLWRDELVTRIDVEPLGADDMEQLLELSLPGGIDGRARTTLLAAAAGNLLYLRELVTGLTESGTLSDERGHWELTGPVSAPPRLAELVELRLRALSVAARNLLNAIALGEPLGAHGVRETGAWQLAEELLGAGLVELVEHGRRRQLRPVHPLHVEVARSTMSEEVLRRTLDQLADALELRGCRRRDDARRLASWRLDAGRPADAAVLVDAAREALGGRDLVLAERFARAALETAGLADELRLQAAQLLGVALDDQGRFDEAEAVMAAHEPGAGSGALRTRLALSRSGNLFRGLGDHERGLEVLAKAEADLTDPDLLAELTAQRASFAVFSGQVERTLELTEPLLDGAGDRAFCESALQTSVAHLLAGRSHDAVQIATRGFETRVRLGDQVELAEPGIHLVALALAQTDAGQVVQAHHTARAGYDAAVSVGDRHGQAWMAVVLARAELLLGRLVDAARHGREAALVFGELRHPGTRWGFGCLLLAAGQLGDEVVAGEAAEDLDAEPPTPLTLMDVDIERGRAWCLVAEGRHSAARAALAGAAERARREGQHSLEAAALHDLARLGDAASVRERTAALAATVQGELMAARALHADGLAHDDGDRLDAAAGSFAALDCHLFAAEAAVAAATAHRRGGAARRAAASELVARSHAERCQGAATPALRSTPAAPELTRREQEVAGLAAAGRSNREIADELVVSVRTVENHLQRVYAKVGVRSREELARALDPS